MPRTLNKTELPLKAIRIIINTNPLYNKHDAVYLIHAYTLVDYIHLVSKVAKSCQVLKVKALLAKLCVTGRNGVILGSIFRQKVHQLCTHCTGMVDQSIAFISDLSGIYVYLPCYSAPRYICHLGLYILAIDLPTVLYIQYHGKCGIYITVGYPLYTPSLN